MEAIEQETENKLFGQDSNASSDNKVEGVMETETTKEQAKTSVDHAPYWLRSCFRAICWVCCGCCFRCCKAQDRWPRLFALLFGMILPLFSLIMVAFVCGYILAIFESGLEIERNDDQLAAREQIILLTFIFGNLTTALPSLCLELFARNRTMEELLNLIDLVLRPSATLYDQIEQSGQIINPGNESYDFTTARFPARNEFYNDTRYINLYELDQFMVECGNQVAPLAQGMFRLIGEQTVEAYTPLTFSWNRCPPPSNSSRGHLGYNSIVNGESDQEQWYTKNWYIDQQQLYQTYLAEITQEHNRSGGLAKYLAWNRSLYEATGKADCYKNVPASAWYWFVVMSTIGYGNQSPSSHWGIAMTYTIGLLSILMFAGVSSSSGHVLSTIAEDGAHRFGFGRWWSRGWVVTLFWGGVYFIWLIWISLWYQAWNKARVSEDVTMNNAYWFSYISTTTVGFGDLVLDPEFLTPQDIITFPLFLLLGFVLLALFFGSMAGLFSSPLRNKGMALVDRLRRQAEEEKANAREQPNEQEQQPGAEKREGDDRQEEEFAHAPSPGKTEPGTEVAEEENRPTYSFEASEGA